MWAVSDDALLAGLATGDPDAAAAFLQRFQRRVFGLAVTIVGDPRAAEDISQEAFVRAWRHAGAYDSRRGTVATWLLTFVVVALYAAFAFGFSVIKLSQEDVRANQILLQKLETLRIYDWSKITWVGSTTPTTPMLYMWANTPYKTIHDVRTATVPPKCGATGTGNTGYYLPKLLEQTIGAKFQIVTGYQGGADIEIAVERGEVQCRAFTIQVFYGREPFHTWRSKNQVRVLVQGGKKRDPRLADTPLLSELMEQYKTSDLDRRLVTVMLGSGEFGAAPMFAAPGTPPEHIKLLRAGYAKALASPELIADAKKQGLEPELIHGDELEALAKEVLNQPAEVVASMKKVMGE